jgi:hypothetical protein
LVSHREDLSQVLRAGPGRAGPGRAGQLQAKPAIALELDHTEKRGERR